MALFGLRVNHTHYICRENVVKVSLCFDVVDMRVFPVFTSVEGRECLNYTTLLRGFPMPAATFCKQALIKPSRLDIDMMSIFYVFCKPMSIMTYELSKRISQPRHRSCYFSFVELFSTALLRVLSSELQEVYYFQGCARCRYP